MTVFFCECGHGFNILTSPQKKSGFFITEIFRQYRKIFFEFP